MKILYIIDALGRGGKERRLIQLLQQIDSKKNIHAKIVILTNIIHYDEIHNINIELIILKRKVKKDPRIIFQLFNICRRWKPDIIHAWGSMPAVFAVPVAKVLKIKLINAMIADAPKTLGINQYIRSIFTFPFSNVIQGNSHAGIKSYNVKNNKGNVIHNGYDFSRSKNLKDEINLRNSLKLSKKYVVGMVAGFGKNKDYKSYITAAKIVLDKRNDVSFLCIGDGLTIKEIKKTALNIDDIIFTGRRDDVESIINILDIGILLTNTSLHGEGISNSIMEYMAIGKSVIATDSGGTKELIIDNETGFIIPDKSPEILADKIEYLLNNPTIKDEMGRKGKERILKEFNINKMVDSHINLYHQLIKS